MPRRKQAPIDAAPPEPPKPFKNTAASHTTPPELYLPLKPLSQRGTVQLSNGRTREQEVTWQQMQAGRFLHNQAKGKYYALMQFVLTTWPEFVEEVRIKPDGQPHWETTKWVNPWMLRILKAFTNHEHVSRHGDSVFRSVVLTGCAGVGKSHLAAMYAVAWWLVDPDNSIAILTSTTVGMIRARLWPQISHYYETAQEQLTGRKFKDMGVGHMVNSQMRIESQQGDAKHAIFAMAVALGETKKALNNLKGLHAPRMLLIVDEANGTPEAIFEIISNYRKGCRDLTVIIIGNPLSRLDPHGRALTPENGWPSITEDVIQWRTQPVPEWQLDSGLAIRFDGKDSPNVKLGFNKYPYIYSLDNWQSAQTVLNTFGYWTMDRGMHPPEGFSNTVFTEQLFMRCLGSGEYFTFISEREPVAFLDPAFGGDACMLAFGEVGDIEGGKKALQLVDMVEITFDPGVSNYEIEYQIARRVQAECTARRVKPACFGLDATGIGRGVAAILMAEWSPQLHALNWGIGATSRPSAQHDGRPARDVYDRYVTEIWFSVRELLEAGQIKGFRRSTISQFISRTYEMRGRKYSIEKKEDMKSRVRYSPDEADAVAGICEVARRIGLEISGKLTDAALRHWERESRGLQDDGALDVEAVVGATAGGGYAEEEAGW
jgi:hypothetical protein